MKWNIWLTLATILTVLFIVYSNRYKWGLMDKGRLQVNA